MPAVSVRRSQDEACCFRSITGNGLRVIWEVTTRCNLKCAHCFVKADSQSVTTAEALRVITEFPLIPVNKVMFTGGEPFLRPDLPLLAEACLSQGILVDIATNLTLMTPEMIRVLRQMGLPEVTTSLDGPQPVHDAIRGASGNFHQVTQAMSQLREAGIAVDLVCVAQRANADFIGETIAIAHSLGASSITISGFIPRSVALGNRRRVELLPGQLADIGRQIEAARNHYGEKLPIRTVSLLKRFEAPAPCPVQNLIGIDARGLVSNCLLAPVPASLRADMRSGLRATVATLNRDYCCAQVSQDALGDR